MGKLVFETNAGDIAATRSASIGRPLNVLLWCVQAALALVFVNAGRAKMTEMPEMLELFAALGVGQWLRYVTGFIELTGAVLILVPKTRRIGAALLATVMLGAVAAHLFILHVPPTTPGVLLVMAAFVVWGRR
ncbi:MAG: DoxX family protein [Gemmatimonadaceae bacterium]